MIIPRVTVTHIIPNQSEVHQQLLVCLLIPGQGVHQTHGGSHTCTIDTNVLEVIRVTTVTSLKLRVDGGGMGGISSGDGVLVGTPACRGVQCYLFIYLYNY